MTKQNIINLTQSIFEEQPFPFFCATSVLQNNLDNQLHRWFEETAIWDLTETEFYEQYEFSLFDIDLPLNLQSLIHDETIESISLEFKNKFNLEFLELVGITAHKLISGQHIGVHNDFINGEETHRLVIQLNPNWDESNGGFLMLFNSSNAEDISKIIQPLNNSAFGFEISKNSHHAVSKIYDYSRYSLVYTFKGK